MRLATLRRGDGSVACAIEGDRACEVDGYRDVGDLLRDGERGLEAAREASADARGFAFEQADLLRPVLAPGAIFCVGLNYRSHVEELGIDLPSVPTLFDKLPRAMADPFAPIPDPRRSGQLDYEGELAVVIGRPGRDVPAERAWDHVAGLSVLNDVSVRDLQTRTSQWFAGKNWRSSTPWGPWVSMVESPPDMGEMRLTVDVSGERRQVARLDDLIFGVAELIADISRICGIEPGDVIATGTPGGVGMAGGNYLRAGDEVTVTITGIGQIRNRVAGMSDAALDM